MVDDEPSIRQLCAELLIRSGYHVDTAASGFAAWDILQLKIYDLLITDYNMRGLNGIELIRKVRAVEMKLSVILMSGMMPTAELKLDPWLQIEATLSKPFSNDKLLAVMREVLSAISIAPLPGSGPENSAMGTTPHSNQHRCAS